MKEAIVNYFIEKELIDWWFKISDFRIQICFKNS
jgi:hypothetical protein